MKHLKIHLGPNVYLCNMCPQSFAKFKQLKDHQMQHYKNDPDLLHEMRKKEETSMSHEDESFEHENDDDDDDDDEFL
jgi:hypothetical protein